MLDRRPDRKLGRPRRQLPAALLAAGLAAVLVMSACTQDEDSGAATSDGGTEQIPQPAVANIETAPDSARVDLTMPTFSNPTDITNPLFPVSSQDSVLLLGRVDGKAFRTEVTTLPDPRIIEWEGQQVPALVSQYVAYLDGRLHEVAYDFYAQDDDGSVWYFGEDVFNFADGAIVDTHGTWIAGKDGPAAMIMPGDPKVGDVYRPENIPGFVFEEVTVKSVDQTLDGPLGPIQGGLEIEELHMDGATEAKSFAPGYGEFYTAGGGDVEALALAVPTDAASEPVPSELTTLEAGATDAFEAAQSGDWKAASAAIQKMTGAWESYRAGDVPALVEPRMTASLRSLTGAVEALDEAKSSQAAIDVSQSTLDLQLRYRPQAEIDLARFDLWARQMIVDAKAGDAAAVNGDFFSMDYIRDRIQNSLDDAVITRLNTQLEKLIGAVAEANFAATIDIAQGIRSTIAGSGS